MNSNMPHLPSHTRLRIFAALSTLVMCASAGGYAWLFVQERETITQAAQVAGDAQLLATRNAHTQTVRRVVRDTRDERARLNTYFVNDTELVTFLEEIESLGTYANAQTIVSSVQVGDSRDDDDRIVDLELLLNAEGSFASVMQVLALLEAFPSALDVVNVQLTQQSQRDTWTGVFELVAVRAEAPQGGE